MDPSIDKKSISGSEIAAGAVALAAVALIALLGLRASQPQNLPPAAAVKAPTAAWTPEATREPSRTRDDTRPESQPPGPQPADPVAANATTAPSPPSDPSAELESGPVAKPQRQSIADPALRGSSQPGISESTPPSDAERTQLKPPDVSAVQTRLRELGYFFGNPTGVWWTASRRALHDFKSMNGLAEDHRWDKETEQRLFSEQAIRATSTFIGRWTGEKGQCPHGPGAPLTIHSRGAKAVGGECDFRSVRREATSRWRIGALCFASGLSWNANISLQLIGPRLTWSSERGTATYVRCLNP
jgi:hypothetical protein